jgi:hypothetical protein
MRSLQSTRIFGVLALLVTLSLISARNALAGDGHYWVSHDPSIGYAWPHQRVYQFPAAIVDQPAVPANCVVYFPGVIPFPGVYDYQPGPAVRVVGSIYAAYDQYAGPSSIPR